MFMIYRRNENYDLLLKMMMLRAFGDDEINWVEKLLSKGGNGSGKIV